MFRRDHFLAGLLPALLLPFAGGFAFYVLFFGHMRLGFFVKHILSTQQWVSVLSLGVILNLGLFMLHIRHGRDRAARGVLAATFAFAFVVVFFKVL
jgi:hypothetical protein